MNSAIQNFIEQATEFKQTNIDIDGNPIYREVFSTEKFAELIIRKCISICKENETPNLYRVRQAEQQIKLYFNIE